MLPTEATALLKILCHFIQAAAADDYTHTDDAQTGMLREKGSLQFRILAPEQI